MLLELYKTPLNVYKLKNEEINNLSFLSDKDKIELKEKQKLDYKMIIKKELKKHQMNTISISDDYYPKRLKEIYDMPYSFYYKGVNLFKDKDYEKKKAVAIVGSRDCSEYGRLVAKRLAKRLAEYGIIVISGMAEGIDTAAHEGALSSNGKTIAILGSGLSECYPKSNYNLMKEIEKKSMIISEYDGDAKPLKYHFPKRNRIISGLSDVIVVVEAKESSGSLITARMALDEGRDVCVIPGDITRKTSKGTNKLIKEGAIVVTEIEDILELLF